MYLSGSLTSVHVCIVHNSLNDCCVGKMYETRGMNIFSSIIGG